MENNKQTASEKISNYLSQKYSRRYVLDEPTGIEACDDATIYMSEEELYKILGE